MLREWAAVKHH